MGGWSFKILLVVVIFLVVRSIINNAKQGKTPSQEQSDNTRSEAASAYEPSFTVPSYEPETYTVPSVIVPEGMPYWKPFTRDDKETMIFDRTSRCVKDADTELLDIIKTYGLKSGILVASVPKDAEEEEGRDWLY